MITVPDLKLRNIDLKLKNINYNNGNLPKIIKYYKIKYFFLKFKNISHFFQTISIFVNFAGILFII